MDVSKRVQLVIQALGLNNNSFAKKIGVSSTTVDGYIKGRKNGKGELIISLPNYDSIRKMATVFGVNPNYILGLTDEMFISGDGSEVKGSSLNDFSVQEIITHIFNQKEKFREDLSYQLFMENELKEKVIEKLKEEKEKLLNKKSFHKKS